MIGHRVITQDTCNVDDGFDSQRQEPIIGALFPIGQDTKVEG